MTLRYHRGVIMTSQGLQYGIVLMKLVLQLYVFLQCGIEDKIPLK